MERIKRAVCLILCFVMVFGLLPMHAFAATGTLEDSTVVTYQRVDQLTSGKQYLIVNRNSAGNGYALGSSTAGVSVTVGSNGVISDKRTALEWTATGSGSSWKFSSGSYNLGVTVGGSFGNRSFTLNTGTDSSWTYSSSYSRLAFTYSSIYTRYLYCSSNGTWGVQQGQSNVYFYERTETPVTGAEVDFTVSPESLELQGGESQVLTPSVLVAGAAASGYEITWESSDSNVATVGTDGTVTGMNNGDTTITATLTAANGTAMKEDIVITIPVSVKTVTLSRIEVSGTEGITTCVHKDADFSNVVVKAIYSDGSEVTLTEGVTFTYENAVGQQTVTATFEGKTATFPITVEEETAVGQLVGNTSFTFFQNTAEDFSGLSCVLTYPCGHTETVAADKLTISGYDMSEIGTYENCSVSYNGTPVGSVTVNVVERTATSVEGTLTSGIVYQLDTDGVTANKKYLIVNTGSDGSGVAMTNNGNNNAGNTTVQIVNGKITVLDDSMIAWVFTPNNTSYRASNNGRYIYMGSSSFLSTSTRNLNISRITNIPGAYTIRRGSDNYYVTFSNNSWSRNGSSSSYVYLYEYVSEGTGEKVVFTLNQSVIMVRPGETETLTGSVVVGNKSYTLDQCDIDWTISPDGFATVEGGVVKGITDGTATVTATLNSVDGQDLSEPISLDVKVTVKSKALVSAKLEGNDPVTTKLGVEPDFSKIKLTVGYEDGTSAVITTANGLVIEGYDKDEIGFYYATISYGGKEYGTVRVTVDGNPYEGKDPATDYPKYPEDGAVRIDKTAEELDFQTSGLVQVELDVAGVSIKKAVDVVLTIDVSNSMAWETGTKTDNFTANKLTEVMEAVKTFANILLADNDDGTPTRNTITIVTFAGKDSENWNNTDNYSDSVRTLVTGTSSLEVINAIADNSKFVGKITINGTTDYGLQLGYIPEDADPNDVNNVVVTDPFLNRGDTNYDYAFWQTNKAIEDGDLGGSGRDIYVLFMTDGCPSNYNNIYYRSKNVAHAFQPGTEEVYGYYAASNGTDWTDHIKNTLIAQNGGNIYAKALYEKLAGMYAVGFDMKNGSFSGITTWSSTTDWEAVFNDIVSKSVVDAKGNGLIKVTAASDTETLYAFYESMGRALRNAGTYANVTDIVDPDFTLQMSNQAGTEGQGAGLYDLEAKGYSTEITVKLYDLWTKAEAEAEDIDTNLIGTRKVNAETGKEIFEAVETVTFNDDGTAAYSSLIDGGNTNIMTVVDGTTTIAAHYFTYTKTPEGVETFKWEIGTITDKEIALSYMAYLKGSREGKEPNGLKYTNQEAVLEYIDINDKYAQQTFPRPAVAWGGASTAYEFYLVNEQGQPCDRQGNEIPFANRIIITGPFFEELYLNQGAEEIAQEIIAVKVLPAGYTLYDDTAKYEVLTASGDNVGHLIVSQPAEGKVQTTKIVSVVEPSYIQSRVAFGVMYNMIPSQSQFVIAPDRVVVDYGKPIVINVNENNKDIPTNEVTAEFIGFSKFYDNVDVTQQFKDTPYSTPFEGLYGTFSINSDGNVLYTPTKLINNIGKVFCVYRITAKDNASNVYYMVSELDVIPATVVYYETDFVKKQINDSNAATLKDVFTYTANWEDPVTDDIAADGPQNDGTIGQNTYGYDSTYANDAKLSDNNSQFAKGQGYTTTYVTFSFTGTGFDLISRTGTEQGLIQVKVATDAAMNNVVKTVSVLNKSETNFELYQIPVVSINGLEHGTYYVKIGVNMAFEAPNEALAALTRGNEFYFDAIRIYDPAKGNELAESAYNADGEANNVITEVRQELITAETFEAIPSGSNDVGMVFIDRSYTDGGINLGVGSVNVSNYSAVGPNNEVYLAQGQAIAFKMKSNLIPASFDVGAKSVTGDAAKLKVTVTPSAGSTRAWTVEAEIESSTVQFINLLTESADTSVFTKDVYVIITNNGAGVLSITDIKTAYSVISATGTVVQQNSLKAGNISTLSVMGMGITPPASIATTTASEIARMADPFAVAYTVDAATLEVARIVLTASDDVEDPSEPEEPTEPSEPEIDTSIYDIISASVKKTGSKKNVKYTITVVTTQEVEEITVSQGSYELKPSKISYKDNRKDGSRKWTIVVTFGVSGMYDCFTLTGSGEDGITGDAFTVSKPR